MSQQGFHPLKDFLECFRQLDGKPFRKKIEYIFMYYKVHLVVLIVILILAGAVVRIIRIDHTPTLISGIFYTGTISGSAEGALKADLSERLGVDPSDYLINVYTVAFDNKSDKQMQGAAQMVTASIIGGTLDFLVAFQSDLEQMVDQEENYECDLANLETFLDKDEYARLFDEGRIVSVDTEYFGIFPCMILLDDSALARKVNLTGHDNYLGIPANAPHPEAVRALIEMIRN